MRFPQARDFRKTNLELNQLAEDIRRRVVEVSALDNSKADAEDVAAAGTQQELLQWFLQF